SVDAGVPGNTSTIVSRMTHHRRLSSVFPRAAPADSHGGGGRSAVGWIAMSALVMCLPPAVAWSVSDAGTHASRPPSAVDGRRRLGSARHGREHAGALLCEQEEQGPVLGSGLDGPEWGGALAALRGEDRRICAAVRGEERRVARAHLHQGH